MEKWAKEGRLEIEREIRPLVRDYVEMLILTGMRHGTEALNICWDNIEWHTNDGKKYLRIWVDGKTGGRWLIAKHRAIDVLKRLHSRQKAVYDIPFDRLFESRDPSKDICHGRWTSAFAYRRGHSPLETVEHGLHPWVAFLVLPVFAFSNAGVVLSGVTLDTLLAPIPLGIILGLFVGKTIGVFGVSYLLIRLGWVKAPAGTNTMQLLGISILCGIGFTMSLFVGGLAFVGLDPGYTLQLKIGVLCGSLISGVVGTIFLLVAAKQKMEA